MSDEKNNIHYGNSYDLRNNKGTNVMGNQTINNNFYTANNISFPTLKRLNFKVRRTADEVFGRKEDIEKLRSILFEEKQVVLMNSIGGIGKTTTALYYASEYADDYQHLIWIDGTNDINDFLVHSDDLHQNLHISEQVRQLQASNQHNQILALVHHALFSLPQPCLFIIDNATTFTLAQGQEWHSTQPNHHFLFTSREKDPHLKEYPLHYLSDAAALEVFYKWAIILQKQPNFLNNKATYDAALLQLFGLIRNHTQAIVVIAKTFEAARTYDIEGFCAKYTVAFTPLLDKYKIKMQTNASHEFGREIMLRLFDLSGLNTEPTALFTLTQLAALPARNLDFNILKEIIPTQANTDTSLVQDEYDLQNALNYLEQYGWLTSNTDHPFNYDCHPLIQEAVRAQQNTTDDTYTPLVQKIKNILAKNNTTRFWENKPYLPYAITIEQLLSQENKLQAHLCNNMGLYYNNMNDFEKAFYYFEKGLDILEKVLGTEHTDTASSYNNTGVLYSQKNDLDTALDYYQKALAIQEKVWGKEHRNTATSYNNIGFLYYQKNDLDTALDYYQKALDIQEKVLGTEDTATANSYNNIGFLYYQKNDLDTALAYYQKALAIQEKVWGKEHRDTANSYNNIGLLYDSKDNLNTALEYYQKALVIREKVLGIEHTDTAISYNNIGFLYAQKGDFDKVLYFVQKAYGIFKNKLGDEHPDTKNSYEGLQIIQAAIQERESNQKQ